MTYLKLFLEFFKTGLFAIGGGMATIPFLQEIADKYPWYSTADLIDMIAISESTPGPVGVNMATYAGYMAGSFLGGVLATLSLVLPSYIIIVIVARMMDKFRENKYVNYAFLGLRPAVVALMGGAALSIFRIAMAKSGIEKVAGVADIDIKAIVVFAVLFAVIFGLQKFKDGKYKLHPVVYILSGAIIGILL